MQTRALILSLALLPVLPTLAQARIHYDRPINIITSNYDLVDTTYIDRGRLDGVKVGDKFQVKFPDGKHKGPVVVVTGVFERMSSVKIADYELLKDGQLAGYKQRPMIVALETTSRRPAPDIRMAARDTKPRPLRLPPRPRLRRRPPPRPPRPAGAPTDNGLPPAAPGGEPGLRPSAPGAAAAPPARALPPAPALPCGAPWSPWLLPPAPGAAPGRRLACAPPAPLEAGLPPAPGAAPDAGLPAAPGAPALPGRRLASPAGAPGLPPAPRGPGRGPAARTGAPGAAPDAGLPPPPM